MSTLGTGSTGAPASVHDALDAAEAEGHDAGPRVDRAIDSIHHAIGDIRNLIVALRPGALSEVGLAAGLMAIADETREHTAINISVDLPENLRDADSDATGHLLALASEALSNVVRHSQATVTHIRVSRATAQPGVLVLTIEDDGRGFDPDAVARHGHQGLANMRDRAAVLGGTITWSQRAEGGTRVEIQAPWLDAEGSEGT